MRILKIKRDLTTQMTTVYDLINDQEIESLPTNKADDLVDYLKKEIKDIDYMFIPLNRPYRDACYGIERRIKLVIAEEEIMQFLSYVFGESFVEYMMEAAVSLEGNEYVESDMTTFFACFYQAKTREEAEIIYNKWQEYIPLNDTVFYRILRTLESYRIEILNYFDVRNYLKEGVPSL